MPYLPQSFGYSLALLLAVLLLALVALAISYRISSSSSDNDICMSEECVRLSSQISRYMDMSVDPCEDFYSFTCKGFKEDSIIPFGQKTYLIRRHEIL